MDVVAFFSQRVWRGSTLLFRLIPHITYKRRDEDRIPVRPTWSINELLSSYPKPTISTATLKHLHILSALIPPEEGSLDHTKLIEEMQDLVKLVEAVKLVTDGVDHGNGILDRKIWAEGTGIDL